MDVCVHVHQYPVCGKPLGTVRGDGIAMIEVPHFRGVESDGAHSISIPLPLILSTAPLESLRERCPYRATMRTNVAGLQPRSWQSVDPD